MCRKAGKYEIGRTKILWGLHLFISTYFPDCCFPLLDISLCQNEHHTTHFKVTFPTHKTRSIRPTSTYPTQKLSRPPHPSFSGWSWIIIHKYMRENIYEIHSMKYFLGVNDDCQSKRTAKADEAKLGLGSTDIWGQQLIPICPCRCKNMHKCQKKREKVIKLKMGKIKNSGKPSF